MSFPNHQSNFTKGYKAIANPDFQHRVSKSRKKVEIKDDGSTHANNQRILDVDSFYGTMMPWDGKCEQLSTTHEPNPMR